MSNKVDQNFRDPAFASTQRGVVVGMAVGVAASVLVFTLGSRLLPAFDVSGAADRRFAALLPWLSVLALPLVASVGAIASHRFFHRDAIDGTNDAADEVLTVRRAILQNTTEQTLLAALAFLILTAGLPADWLAVPPLFAIWFVFARVAFAVGYRRGAAARSVGFAATFYPSAAAIVVVAAFLVAGAVA